MAKEKGRKNVSDYDFAMAYATCDSVQAVADKVGLAYGSVLSRAKSMRKAGIKLKEMPRAGGNSKTESHIAEINAALAALETEADKPEAETPASE